MELHGTAISDTFGERPATYITDPPCMEAACPRN
jgi:hypothetical protein